MSHICEKKNRFGDEIVTKVNSRGNERRTVAELKKKVGEDEERQPPHHLRSSLSQDRGWQKGKRAVLCQPDAGHTWC